MNEKLCIDCAYYRPDEDVAFDGCDAPDNVKQNSHIYVLVRGDQTRPGKQWAFCRSARQDFGEGMPSCGAVGRWFKPKDPAP